jgi:hypothetical protein
MTNCKTHHRNNLRVIRPTSPTFPLEQRVRTCSTPRDPRACCRSRPSKSYVLPLRHTNIVRQILAAVPMRVRLPAVQARGCERYCVAGPRRRALVQGRCGLEGRKDAVFAKRCAPCRHLPPECVPTRFCEPTCGLAPSIKCHSPSSCSLQEERLGGVRPVHRRVDAARRRR